MDIPAIVLDCDKKSQEGVIQPLGRNGVPIIALSSKRDCAAFHSKYVSQAIVTPSIDHGIKSYIDFLIGLPTKGVLIYSNDVSAVAISKYRNTLKEAGFFLNIANDEILEQVFDKWECFKLAKKLGIPMAETRLVHCLEDVYSAWDDLVKPVILKGTRLAGGNYFKLESKDQIPRAWERMCQELKYYDSRKSAVILQEWKSYDMTDNWSCETLYKTNSTPVGFFTIRRIRCSLNEDGTFSSMLLAGYYQRNKELEGYTKKILDYLKWQGFAHVEYFYVPAQKQFFLTEVNPRLPGYSYYPGAAGFNAAFWYYCDLMQKSFEVPNKFPKSIYFRTFDYLGDFHQAVIYIPRGHIKFLSFFFSYMKLLKPGYIKIIDPIRLDDFRYSFYLLNAIINRILNKFFSLLNLKRHIV